MTAPQTVRALALAMICAVAQFSSAGFAAAQSPANKPSLQLRPVVLDSKNSQTTALGMEYALKGEHAFATLDGDDGSSLIDASATVTQFALSYNAIGTLASSARRNPRNFLEFGSGVVGIFTTAAGTFRLSGSLNYEADQSFISKQLLVTGAATYGKLKVFAANDFLGVTAGYSRINPAGDTARATTLGQTELSSYGRVYAEMLYMLPITAGPFEVLELNYRYFGEPSAPGAIKVAGLNRRQLATARLSLKNNLFLAYSAGSLPFDRRDDSVIALGWAYKLQ